MSYLNYGYGSGSYGGYSSYSYWGDDFYYPKQDTLVVKEHDFYYTPSLSYLKRVLEANNLSTQNGEFFQELTRFFSHQSFNSRDYINPIYEDLSKLNERKQQEVGKKLQIFEEMYDKYIPGYTPTEKALFFLQYFKEKYQEEDVEQSLNKGDITEIMDDFIDNLPGKDVWENPYLEKLVTKKNFKDFKTLIPILNKISQIDSFGKSFEVRKKVTEKRVQNSVRKKMKRLHTFEEIINIPLYQMMYPDFSLRMAKKELIVNTPVEPEIKKQKILIVIDDSGSMNETFKKDWVTAILANRLQYAMKKECEVFVSLFETRNTVKSYKWYHIYDEESALKFWDTFNYNPHGGGTDVSGVIDEISKEILTNKKLFNINQDLSIEKPEILVVNDKQNCPLLW